MTTQKQFYGRMEKHAQTIDKRLNRQRDKILAEIKVLRKDLQDNPSKFAGEIDFIEDKIIPYVKRKKHLPASYRKMLKVMKDNLTT